MSEDEVVCPGDWVGHTSEFSCGTGCHVVGNVVRAPLLGRKVVSIMEVVFFFFFMGRGPSLIPPPSGHRPRRHPPPKERFLSPDLQEGLPVVSISSPQAPTVTPQIGDVVTVRVVRTSSRQVNCDILCVGTHALGQKFSGIIRSHDVRATEVDKVELSKCFRPGDLVRAQVLSLGDARAFFLTTAGNALGVVHAKSLTSGKTMVPLSWEEMQCPETLVVEKRKIAEH